MKRTKLRSRRPQSKKSQCEKLHKKCWQIFSQYIRRKERGVCFSCGVRKDWKEMDAGHFRHGRLDYDTRNIHCQCTRCNRFLHGNLGVYAEKLVETYGGNILMEIHREAAQIKKWEPQELQDLIEHYQKEIAKL